MSKHPSPEQMGEPALQAAGFQLWIHGRQYPDSEDEYDGNWLRVTAHCGASGASVWAQGSILAVTDIHGFGEQCAAMRRGEANSATLDPIEPELKITLETADRLGHIDAQIEITPDHPAQLHSMGFEVDQSHLPRIVAQCSAIVREFPVRGHIRGAGG